MNFASVILLGLTLSARCSYGLPIITRQTGLPAALAHDLSNATSAVDKSRFMAKAPEKKAQPMKLPSQTTKSASHSPLALYTAKRVAPVLVRPNAGKGSDNITYGLMIMNFYGTSLNTHTFSVDMVMSLKWNDTRVIDLIPAGHDQLTMAWNQALKRVWMPGVVVTNRDIEKYEITSASVTIFRTGEVLRVERAQARIMMKFKLEEYPFDTQHLQIRIASSKYMLNEVTLVEDKNASQVREDIFGLYDLEGYSAFGYETTDGFLRKSRGVLDVEVKRKMDKYWQDHLWPTFIVLSISWSVFYFPFANPFITARLILSILALLQFTNLMMKSSKELPGAAPFNWNDLLNQQIQTLMFLTIALNIFSEICAHTFKNEDLARWINHTGKFMIPGTSIVSICVILGSARDHWMTLDTATIAAKAAVWIMMLSYGSYVSWGVYKNIFGAKGQAEMAHGMEEGAQEDADADADGGGDGDGGGDDGCDM